ncbi:MAG: hypothetical protein Kow0042_00910 [Calditrichia bacterium]
MKKIHLVLITLLIFSTTVLARAPFTEFKVGYLDPEKVKAGYIFGVNLGRMIDESLSWSFDFNYFQKTYKRTATIYGETSGNITPEIKQLELEFTTRIIPILAKLNYEHPLGYKSPFYVRASAGLGWELLWNSEDNYVENVHKTRFYHGFGWQASAGVGFEISSSANFFVDAFYNGSTVKRNKKKVEGLPTWEELDISGIGFRIGVSIVGFGW